MPLRRASAAPTSRLVPRLLAHVRERGGDADGLIRRFGLPADVERMKEVAQRSREFEGLMAAVASEARDPLIALHLPALLAWPTYNTAELVARASPTLREVFEHVCRYASLFYRDLVLATEERDGEILHKHRVRGGSGRFANEYGLSSALHHLRHLSGRDLAPKRVWFMHERPREAEAVARFFGTRHLAFGRRHNAMVFDADVLALPTLTGDARLLATAVEVADEALAKVPRAEDLAHRVARELGRGPLGPQATPLAMARRLKLGERTLQRRLHEQGTSFSRGLDEVRRERAFDEVAAGERTLAEIAERLGFSDVATFGRAFKRWSGGMSPGAFRRRRR